MHAEAVLQEVVLLQEPALATAPAAGEHGALVEAIFFRFLARQLCRQSDWLGGHGREPPGLLPCLPHLLFWWAADSALRVAAAHSAFTGDRLQPWTASASASRPAQWCAPRLHQPTQGLTE